MDGLDVGTTTTKAMFNNHAVKNGEYIMTLPNSSQKEVK